MTENIRIRGSLTFRDDATVADVRALIELEADREDGVPEISRWVTFDGQTLRCRGALRSSYAGWRALQRVMREIAQYAKGGRIDLDHDLAGRVGVRAREREAEWIDDFSKVLERIKRSFGGARLDDRQQRIHLERSAGRVTVPFSESPSLIVAWSRAFAPSDEVLFVRNRFSEVAPTLEGDDAVHHVARVLVCHTGGRSSRTPIRLDRAPLSALDPTSLLLERSPAPSAFACAYFLGRGIAYELHHGEVEVTAADMGDPHIVALR